MEKGQIRLTVLGARGSMPVSTADKMGYGGATSAYLVETEDQAVFLDAGTGIINAPEVGEKSISLLISHPHVDHLMGLPMFPPMMCRDRRIDVYSKSQHGRSAREQVEVLMSEPLWPVGIGIYPANVIFHDIDGDFSVGGFTVDTMSSVHPGGSTIFGLTYGDRRIVYATDYEHTEDSLKKLAEFCKGAELVLYDAQYTEEEYPSHRGFGHSTANKGLELMQASGAKQLLFVHHDPFHTDAKMAEMEAAIKNEAVSFAKEGQTLTIG